MSKAILPNKVRAAYEDILYSFQTAVEQLSGQVFFPDRPVASCFTRSGNTTVEFKRCLYLKGLPSRRLSGSKRLDLVIMVLEELERVTGEHDSDEWTLRKSTVQLNYFVVANGIGKLAQSLHFDFDQAGQADHPFFHVQLTDDQIVADECMTEHKDFEIQAPSEPSECYVTTRIPTCDMTLASVLYCVAADHLRGAIFTQFAQKVDVIQNALPSLRFDALKTSVGRSPLHFKSAHWFAHMQTT